ncbi:hypothetical protein DY000_02040426 [Brassica cretica]|uniref:Uncharacterized protein n=1 Tax=Brassica cretica TaxID=69181 RepID=A0ABQ7B5J2_BRACR|nr:hypothetical protein DY000_02040426 [Brassica cretica]
MGGKGQLLAAGSNETAYHLSPLSFALCFVKPSPEVRRVFSLKFISTKFILKLEEIGDRKYSENLGSTIEEHRPCHFRSSKIGGVTPSLLRETPPRTS